MTAYGKQPDKTLAGKKIKLIKLKSLKLATSPTPGTTGIIESVDGITGKIHVKWETDNNSILESSISPGVDEYEIQFADEDFSKYMGTKGESYIIDKSGKGERELFYLIRAKSPHHMVDMFFSSQKEAEKFASKKGLIIKDKIEEKYVDGGVIGESEVLTYLKTKYGVEENQITVGKDNKGKWNILIIDSELDPKIVSKWEKEVNKVFTKGKIVHKTISFDANNHITYYNGDLTFQNIKDLTGITPVKIQNIEYVEIEDVDPFIKWSATELKNMFGYDIQNIIFSKKVLSDNEIEILDAYAITDDELHSFKYSPMIHTWYSIEEDENREKYGSDEEFGNGGNISNELENFDLNDLDPFETMQYNQFSKSLTKSESLQVLINNVEGDYSQLSPKLAGLAEIQNPSEEYADGGPITDMQTLNSFHDWLRFDSKDADTHEGVLMSLKYTSPVAENNYLQKIYPKYKDEFNVYMAENPNAYYANGGGIRKNGGSINKQETELTLENGTVFYIDELPKYIKGTRERRDSELIAKGVNLFFLKNVIGAKGTGVVADTSALDVLATDLEDIKQPTEADVRRAMILKIGYEGDLFYTLKAGGESASDHQYSSSVTATFEGTKNGEDTDRVIIKKYNSDFKKVLITGAEVREIKRIILKIKRTKLMREDEVQGTIDFIASSERRGKVDISDGGTQPYTEEFRKAMIENILNLAGDDVKLIAHCINYRVNQARKEIERIGDQDCIYIVDDKYMTLERCKEQTKKEKDRNFKGIEIYTKLHADIIAEMRMRNNSPQMAADIDAKSEFEPYVEKKAKHGALLHHTFTYQNTPDEKWEVEYEMDRDFPIISTITINGQQTDIDSYDEDIIMKVSMEAYQDYIDNLMTSGEYSREDFAANGKKVESYESYDDFVKKNIGEKNFVIEVGSGGTSQPFNGATKESIDIMFKDLVFHDFMDHNFKSNYCPDEYEKEYIEIVKKFYNELINNPDSFKSFWTKYIVKSRRYNGKYAIQSPHYTREGKRIEYVKIKDKWIRAVKIDDEWIPQEVENYPNVVFHKYKSEISKGLKDAYSKYLQEYAGENIDLAADGKKVSSSNIRTIVFKHKNNPSLNVTVKAYPNMQITEIENPRNVRFPFVVGQVMNMGHQTWACNNSYLVNDVDVCPEKKVMGIKVSDIPHGHPLRHLYPGKFH